MPQYRFDNIIGQREAIDFLQNAIRTGHVPHALILCGEKGSGKRDLAMAFAAALQCAEHGKEPCGHCRSCRQAAADSHPDVILVTNERAGAETKTNTIGVKTARFLQGDVSIKPYEGPYKIYIMPDAHYMNSQAQNALLKALEEPPAYAVLILLAETTAAFLPTILSRCITLKLRPAAENELMTALVNENIPPQRAMICARLSHGNPGRCLQLARDGELEAFRVDCAAFLKRMPEVSSYDIVHFAEGLTSKEGSRVDDFLDFGLSWFRDILTAKGRGDSLIFLDEVTYINNTAQSISFASLESIFQAFDTAAVRRAAKGNDTQIMEVLLLNIRRAMSRR